jgi:hypothetical protein
LEIALIVYDSVLQISIAVADPEVLAAPAIFLHGA